MVAGDVVRSSAEFERELGLGRCSRRGDGWRLGGQTDVGEVAPSLGGVGHEGQQLEPTSAATLLDVDAKDSAQQLGPGDSPRTRRDGDGWFRRPVVGQSGLVPLRGLPWVVGRRRRGNDEISDARARRQAAVVAREVEPLGRHQGGESTQELACAEQDMGRAVVPFSLQREQELIVTEPAQAVVGKRRSQDVAAQLFELVGLLRADPSGCVERKATRREAQITGALARRRVGEYPTDAATGPGSIVDG